MVSRVFRSLQLNINNPVVESFYKQECDNDENKFINNIMHYIETYNIKQSVKRGLKEVKLQNSGQLEKRELNDILELANELENVWIMQHHMKFSKSLQELML